MKEEKRKEGKKERKVREGQKLSPELKTIFMGLER